MGLPSKKVEIEGSEYIITAHPPSESTDLVMEIYATLAGPGAGLIDMLSKAREDLQDGDDVDKVLESLDSEKMSRLVSQSLRDLDSTYIHKLFEETERKNEETGEMESLSNSVAFDNAYAGNWTEFNMAIIEIVKVNGFLDFLLGMTGSENE